MKFIRDLLNRKPSGGQKPVQTLESIVAERKVAIPDPVAIADTMLEEKPHKAAKLKVVSDGDTNAKSKPEAVEEDKSSDEILEKVNAQVPSEGEGVVHVNIWDIDSDDTAEVTPEAAPTPRRRRRNQTRLLGYDDAADDTVSAFDKAEKVAPKARAKFPVGWMLVADGPGRGECFTLEAGMSQIGRAEDQAIQLDFGDNSISRVNHAAVVYDTDTHTFMLGHGGKKNIVRLNDKPVISNENITSGDEIKIGETTLRFIALCTEEFNWADEDTASEEQVDVAIA